MRRGVGISAVRTQQQFAAQASKTGGLVKEEQVKKLQSQLEVFRDKLAIFADKYNKKLNNDPYFRAQFMKMCSEVGIDPLTTFKTNVTIGSLNDFYQRILVQILDILVSSETQLISLKDLLKELEKRRKVQDLTEDDLIESFKRSSQDNSYSVITVNKVNYVVARGGKCSSDMSNLMNYLEEKNSATLSELIQHLNIEKERVMIALNSLMKNTIVWVDDQISPPQYYISAIKLQK